MLRRDIYPESLLGRKPVAPRYIERGGVHIILGSIGLVRQLNQNPLRQPHLQIELHHFGPVCFNAHTTAHHANRLRNLVQDLRHLDCQKGLDASGAG